MQGDQAKCLQAGMNDYTSKPIRIEDLITALSKCPKRISSPGEIIKPTANSTLDSGVLQELKEVICNNISHEYIELITTYLEDIPPRLRSLGDAVTQGNSPPIKLELHALKSSSAIIGAKNLGKLFQQLEDLGDIDTHKTETVLLLSQIIAEYERVEIALKLELRKDAPQQVTEDKLGI
jgi:HPt (histidine-containing phosphotransfer) domain-containing protein